MLILLPPSEGKATVGDGPSLQLDGLSFPKLARSRKRVITALLALCRTSKARDVLGLSEGQAEEIAKNRALRTAPTLPAGRLYTGVLYDNLGLATLDADAAGRAADSLVIFSGLWGVLRVHDHVPPYRLSMGVGLPPLGGLAAFWQPAVAKVLDPEPGLVVDLRSSTYAPAWRPGARAVAIKVTRDGKVVSHMAKATRGAIARSLLTSGADPATPEKLHRHLADLGYRVELGAPPTGRRPWEITCDVT
ncbi:YaaA family protein [Streptosporangium sp. KLBMP 9127]|nr:peroxide stress protein YaaA [Streptosporangium sp. KLBMP 9127]